MRTEECDLGQAILYYNSCIYQDLLPVQTLGQNSGIYPITTDMLHRGSSYPDHVRLMLLCVTLSHRVNRTRGPTRFEHLSESFYLYRGKIIRSLNSDLDVEQKRTSDAVLAGVTTLLLSDVQQGASSNWRHHFNAVEKLIALRGGIREVARLGRVDALLRLYIFIAVIGNTTSPASDLIMTGSHLQDLEFILELVSDPVNEILPSPLSAEIIKINHLRMLAMQLEGSDLSMVQEAFGILQRIYAFSSEDWAAMKPLSHDEWTLIGVIHQEAVSIYCISSLQSVSVLPHTAALRAQCAAHGQRLQTLLASALSSPSLKIFMLWPVIMLGMEAVHGPASLRSFVVHHLPELSKHIGTYVPLTAKGVLERFWASGDTRWDSCFDRPYAFAAQIAVDISGVVP